LAYVKTKFKKRKNKIQKSVPECICYTIWQQPLCGCTPWPMYQFFCKKSKLFLQKSVPAAWPHTSSRWSFSSPGLRMLRRPDLFLSPGGLFSLGTAPRPSPSGCARTSTGSIIPLRDPCYHY